MDKWEYKLLDSKILPEAEKGIFKQPKVTLAEAEHDSSFPGCRFLRNGIGDRDERQRA